MFQFNCITILQTSLDLVSQSSVILAECGVLGDNVMNSSDLFPYRIQMQQALFDCHSPKTDHFFF
jgi:hypothetical protein